jgi:hypothetical protein
MNTFFARYLMRRKAGWTFINSVRSAWKLTKGI